MKAPFSLKVKNFLSNRSNVAPFMKALLESEKNGFESHEVVVAGKSLRFSSGQINK